MYTVLIPKFNIDPLTQCLPDIDVVKTRMQTDPEQYTKGVFSAAKDIVAKEGVGYLLAGLGELAHVMIFSAAEY